jgi:hypothetical protein
VRKIFLFAVLFIAVGCSGGRAAEVPAGSAPAQSQLQELTLQLDLCARMLEDVKELERQKSAAGQQESMQLLAEIRALLLEQSALLAAQLRGGTGQEARPRAGTSVLMGETEFSRKEAARGGKAYRPF